MPAEGVFLLEMELKVLQMSFRNQDIGPRAEIARN
jgi:hypothetical protein